jgi:hypothetical protein
MNDFIVCSSSSDVALVYIANVGEQQYNPKEGYTLANIRLRLVKDN